MKNKFYMISSCLFLLSACSEPFAQVAEPNAITFEGAMAELGRGFTAFEAASGNQPRGIVPCNIDVTFDVAVAASAADSIDLGRTAKLVVTGATNQSTTDTNASARFSRDRSAERSNKINVQFRHLQCLPSDTRAATGQQIQEVAEAVSGDSGGTVLITLPPQQLR